MQKAYPMQNVLELACAAQRINREYVKDMEGVYADDGVLMYYKQPNKICMLFTLGEIKLNTDTDPKMVPTLLKVTREDHEMAEDIKKFYRRLMFSAIAGDSEFKTEVNALLNAQDIPTNKFGYIACLPSVYKRDYAVHHVAKQAKMVDTGFLADIDTWVNDLDTEIISSIKSKNFEGYNIDAIINNKMVSWMSKTDLKLGPAVLVKAKVKAHNQHWKHKNDVTRLNYVKAAQ